MGRPAIVRQKVEEIKRLWEAGYSDKEIAQELGLNFHSMKNVRQACGMLKYECKQRADKFREPCLPVGMPGYTKDYLELCSKLHLEDLEKAGHRRFVPADRGYEPRY